METAQETTGGMRGYLGVVRRRYKYIATIGPITVLLAVYLAFTLPTLYESTATILIEPSTVNKDLVVPTVNSLSAQQIEIVQGRVMKLDTLEALVHERDPYPQFPQLSAKEKAQRILENTKLERVDPVTMKPDQDANAFSLHYDNPDSERAADVANRLAQLFLTYNQRTREQSAKEAATFLASQAQDVSRQMRAIDEEINKFKNAHGEALPEYTQRNENAIDRNQHDLDQVQQEILRDQEKESLLAVELSHTSPNLITEAGDLTDAATVRAKLAEAQQRYTPDHPEVKRLKRALEALMQQTNTTNGVVANATNPLYLSTASQLESTRNELRALRAQADRIRAQMANYEELLRRTPGVEREYADILRRRESLQTAYAQLQDRLQKATVAQNFESGEQGEKFTLLAAPFPGRLPVYPNRIGLILLGITLGGALSAIAMAIAESADSTVRSTKDFPVNAAFPLLASIPRIPNSRDRRRRRLVFTSWAVAYALATLFVGAAVVSALLAHH
ncbi:MAG TPA: hypothetical protein VMT29_09465 [Steroidobacteraceae bacterium]|nr:hypothetical protein [Steroidobacteraceae bacterium]